MKMIIDNSKEEKEIFSFLLKELNKNKDITEIEFVEEIKNSKILQQILYITNKKEIKLLINNKQNITIIGITNE